MRIGHGYDVHRIAEGRKLILCGVQIPSAGEDRQGGAQIYAMRNYVDQASVSGR